MELHSLKNTPGARRTGKRVGRGMSSGRGKTCGRGNKGQKARAGYSRKFGFEGGQMPFIRRIPKRGFHNRSRRSYVGVNVGSLSAFNEGAEVTPALLEKTGLVKRATDGVKILGDGETGKKLTVKAHAFSESARRKITAAGGTCEIVN